MATSNASSFEESNFSFLVHLTLTGVTVVHATTHFNLLSLPIDFGVVLVQPGES